MILKKRDKYLYTCTLGPYVYATPARTTDSLPGTQSGVTEGETH